MKRKTSKHITEEEPQFIVLNEYCQVWTGFREGWAEFSDNIDDAKPLNNDKQLKCLEIYTYHKLEKEYI
jgi:hypothetical protein